MQVVQDPATGGTFIVKAGAAQLLPCCIPLGTFSELLTPLPIPPLQHAYGVHATLQSPNLPVPLSTAQGSKTDMHAVSPSDMDSMGFLG